MNSKPFFTRNKTKHEIKQISIRAIIFQPDAAVTLIRTCALTSSIPFKERKKKRR